MKTKSEILTKYINVLEEISRKRELSYSRMATNAGIWPSTFANWRNGNDPPFTKGLEMLKSLDLNEDEIIDALSILTHEGKEGKIDNSFIKIIEVLMAVKGISAPELCIAAGININTYRNWRKGVGPSLSNAVAIINALQLTKEEVKELLEVLLET